MTFQRSSGVSWTANGAMVEIGYEMILLRSTYKLTMTKNHY